MKSLIIKLLFTSSILLTLCSCRTIETKGPYIDNNILLQLENKKLSKSEVKDLMDAPTIISNYSPNIWYYVQQTLGPQTLFPAKVIKQKIIKIVFNKNDIVEEVVVYNNSHKNNINIISAYTKTQEVKLSPRQKLKNSIKNKERLNHKFQYEGTN